MDEQTTGDGDAASGGGGGGRLRRALAARRGRAALAGGLAAALVAGWLVIRAGDDADADSDAAKRYCWGAWSQGEEPLRFNNDNRTFRETAPTPERPRGSCTITTSWDNGINEVHEKISVSYGSGPKDAKKRRAWLAELFAGAGDQLPEGLPGFVSEGSATLVLPEKCDVDGRPSVVAVSGVQSDGKDDTPTLPDVSSEPWQAGQLLVDIANHGMEKAGCAPEKPLGFAAPIPPGYVPDDTFVTGYSSGACRIDGLRPAPGGAEGSDKGLDSTVGPVSDDLQTCVVRWYDTVAARLTMTAHPRLVKLFDGLTGSAPPARGWRGQGFMDADGALVRARCSGRTAVMSMERTDVADDTPFATPSHIFPVYAAAVAKRLGCAAVTPHGDSI
ncbi:hypothetical protein SBI_03187 [Streptomyces bingchenggensis BCW-1]|uniref:Uncharacterized protein n=2 Tax=Streptomyces TaxID=1883 RepID=D7C8B9_STRBB|nr:MULTISPECIES: hypothetical protein [Streptomyces]ADI06308.1 hypothetical protein SBI_03187 [Streptomyces bingchenggensis BCW-1]